LAIRNESGRSIASHYIFHKQHNGKVRPYFGIGPVFDVGYNSYESISKGNSGGSTKNTSSQTISGAGLSGVLGMEYKVNKWITLLAEYESNAMYRYLVQLQKVEQNRDGGNYQVMSRTEQDEHQFKFGSDAIKMGLTVYF
jgi:hypothetical protein